MVIVTKKPYLSPVGKNFGKLNLELPCITASVSKPEPYADRLSANSVNTELSFTGTHKSFKQRLGGSLHNRFSKPKLSGKTSLRKGGPSLSEQELKRNNIVSSMTSFIPLVQQKQAAAVVTGRGHQSEGPGGS